MFKESDFGIIMEAAETKLEKDGRKTKMVNHIERITRSMSRGRRQGGMSAMDMIAQKFNGGSSARSSYQGRSDLPTDHPISRWQRAGTLGT